MWEQGGASALRRRAATGRPPKLDDTQVETVRAALEQGAQAHGFEAALWTLERVGAVVTRATGVVGERVVLVRDGLSAHWSRAMRAWVAEQDWLTLEAAMSCSRQGWGKSSAVAWRSRPRSRAWPGYRPDRRRHRGPTVGRLGVDGLPQVLQLTADLHEDLVQVPLVARLHTPAA
ncbi:hypothetical protein OG298_40400 [Streptomyces sp. NBC_01005]|nr:hypothetical protein OG298_40400 [Streptomyces sp. NBC_01005]WTC99629.1 hypothetical protein OH736_40415 [Streptomyces sp. NBC_01650]